MRVTLHHSGTLFKVLKEAGLVARSGVIPQQQAQSYQLFQLPPPPAAINDVAAQLQLDAPSSTEATGELPAFLSTEWPACESYANRNVNQLHRLRITIATEYHQVMPVPSRTLRSLARAVRSRPYDGNVAPFCSCLCGVGRTRT